MKTVSKTSEQEIQSLRLIREMIEVSRNKMKNDGILFIVWGWIFVINYFLLNYLPEQVLLSNRFMQVIRGLRVMLPFMGFFYTLYYILKQRRKVQTYIGISLRYVWISLFISLILINLIQMNVLHSINFELQHPIFMVLIAFSVTITGGILRYNLLVAGGAIFGILAFAASYLNLQDQMLLEAIAWLMAFAIPGHIMYAKRKAKNGI